MRGSRSCLCLILLAILADVCLALPATRYGAAFALLWLLPGLAWTALLARRGSRPTAEDVATGLGLGMSSVALLTLLLHYVPGPLPFPWLLIAVNLLVLTLACLAFHTASDFGFDVRRSSLVPLALVVLLAACFRLPHLGYSEFQGDEEVVMMRAARAALGDDAQLFYHQKGPAEVLLPLATWTLAGRINEWQARLPFAFAGLLGVTTIYLLGRRWFGGRVALIAALLLAINGYCVGFGRIVQYQGLVLAVTSSGLLALWRWSEEEEQRWLFAGAALLAFGPLAHYDAGLALPAGVYLVGRRLWRAHAQGRTTWVALAGATALALAIVALFYLPFVRHPNFAKTLEYLSTSRLGTGGPLYNNLLSTLPLATFYNSAYYLVGLAALIVVASFLPFRRRGLLIPAAFWLLAAVSNLKSPLWTGPVLASLLAAVLLSPRSTSPPRAAWLWFGAPFLFHWFLVGEPRTHVLNAFPGAVLLAAFALDRLLSLTPAAGRRLAAAALVAVFLFLAYYPYLMFVQHEPEIKRTWPAHQPALYWRPFEESPHDGYFGFPYRAGWKVVGELIQEGTLSGVYASNEEQEVAGWYTRGLERTYCPTPDWYLIARNVQDEVEVDRAEIETAYYLWGEVRVAGETKLWIYRRGTAEATPGVYRVEDYAARFDAHTTPGTVLPLPPAGYVPVGYRLGETVRLLGYRLDTADARPGGRLGLVLYWEALAPMETRYQVFNHLYDGVMWGQQDGAPACARMPTTFWEPGQIVRDEHTIPIRSRTPVGDIPLLVGMYDLETKDRLPVYDSSGAFVGDVIDMATVTVR